MTRILIVDDQEMIRVGLHAILDRHDTFDVVAEAGDGLKAIAVLESTLVDLVLMDIRMPGIDGVEATRRIRERWSSEQLRIVVLTTFERDETVLAALRAGANGYLSKGASPVELVAAIAEVADGGGALSSAAAAALIGQVADTPAPREEPEMVQRFRALTPRERDIVLAIAKGQDVEAIARTLFLSPFTVKTHINRAMSKVGARDRGQLVAFAFRSGLSGE